jgi:hypothetical protein
MAEIIAEDDKPACPDVGAWAEDKYTLVGPYDRLSSTGMKNKWPTRVYIDLYSGPGSVRAGGKKHVQWDKKNLLFYCPPCS